MHRATPGTGALASCDADDEPPTMTTPPARPVRPSHLGICVSDLESSLRFYCDGLGFVAAETYTLDSADLPGLDRALEVDGPTVVVSQFVRSGDFAIELLAYRRPASSGVPSRSRGQHGMTHLAFHVDDLDAAVRNAVASGGTVIESTRADLGVQLVFLADPDGVRIEFIHTPIRSADRSEPTT